MYVSLHSCGYIVYIDVVCRQISHPKRNARTNSFFDLVSFAYSKIFFLSLFLFSTITIITTTVIVIIIINNNNNNNSNSNSTTAITNKNTTIRCCFLMMDWTFTKKIDKSFRWVVEEEGLSGAADGRCAQ